MCENFKYPEKLRFKCMGLAVYQETYVLFQFTQGRSHEDERLS